MVFVWILVGVVAMAFLVKGSEYFVEASAVIARRLGATEFVIGLTLVAIGTSIPELASTVAAAMSGSTDIIVGNIVGSNITNILLVIGIAGTFTIVKTHPEMLRRDGYMMMFAAALFFVFVSNGVLNTWQALLMIIIYVLYILFLSRDREDTEKLYDFTDFVNYVLQLGFVSTVNEKFQSAQKSKKGDRSALYKDLVIAAFGLIAVVLGAHYLIKSAIIIATEFGVSESVIGLSLIAFGTSVPELSVSLQAARSKKAEMAIGNLVGSNIANILLIGGAGGLITTLTVTPAMEAVTIPVMLLLTALLLLFIRTGWRIRKYEAIIFIVLYVLYIALLIAYPWLFG